MSKHERAARWSRALYQFPDGQLASWFSLGAITDRAVRVWLRLPQTSTAEVSLRLDGRVLRTARTEISPRHDWVGCVELSLDEPRPGQPFEVVLEGTPRHAQFAPSPGSESSFCFGFGSCHQPFASLGGDRLRVHSGAGIYPGMLAQLSACQARFQILLGDQIYSDGSHPFNLRSQLKRQPEIPDQHILEQYRHLYRGYFCQEGFRHLLEEFPTYLVWDDHDVFDGWGALLEYSELDTRMFRAADMAYREYQQPRNPGGDFEQEPPYYYQFWYGNVGFFVMDLRGLRDYRQGRLLGAAQWQALRHFLEAATELQAPTVFLVASVPVVHFGPAGIRAFEWIPGSRGTDLRDRWCSRRFLAERDALLDLLCDWQQAAPTRQAIILSGDVHVGAAFRIDREGGSGRLRQWTSSPLTTRSGWVHHAANWLGSGLVNWGEHPRFRITRETLEFKNNFGLVQVESRPSGGHRIAFELFAHDSNRGVVEKTARLVAEPPG